jgi:uncharacterized protein YdcH (DUF465 family)
MPAMADLGDIQRKQADAAKFAMKMVDEKDPEKLKEMAEQLKGRCDELANMAQGLEAALTPQGPTGPEVRVLLTAEQRARVAEATGIGVEAVTVRDSRQRMWSKEMPDVRPGEIEKLAAQQATASRLLSETRTQVEKIIKELEKLNVPELAETIANLKKDPTLGLAKKQK